MGHRILVVDSDPESCARAIERLKSEGFTAIAAHHGNDAFGELLRGSVDLVLLDLVLDDVSGSALLRKIRSTRETESIPVIVVSAHAEEIDRVLAFELGADDYVRKPFSARELVLRVRAVLRRSGAPPPPPPEDSQRLTAGPLDIDLGRHQCSVEGEPIALTALEFRLLADLAARPGRVQPRAALITRVWRSSDGVDTRTVDTHVKRLRAKLGKAGPWIETVRGVGYRLRDPNVT